MREFRPGLVNPHIVIRNGSYTAVVAGLHHSISRLAKAVEFCDKLNYEQNRAIPLNHSLLERHIKDQKND